MRICVVAHLAYGALSGGASGHVGGVERQTSLLARWLAARGHEVSLVTWDEGQADGEVIDGVRVLRLCRRDAGLPGLRFFHPRWSSLVSALRRADADVYYHNCGEYVTGQVALWCARRRRAFVYSTAADADCDPALPLMRKWRERYLYRIGLRAADRVIVQSEHQQQMLRDGFGVDAVVIPMPCPGPDEQTYRPRALGDGSNATVLWVGRVVDVKRPDRFLDLVESCPEVQFGLAGPADDVYGQAIVERSRGLRNLTLHGSVPRERMDALYRQAALLCCTSDHEGFPNTFLEAWSHGVPVVTTWDPGGVVAQHGLGMVCTGVGELAAAVRALLSSPERWRLASEAARRYYLEHHTVDRVLARFEQQFREARDAVAAHGRERA